MAILSLLAIGAGAVALVTGGRRAPPHAAEAVLLVGAALAMMLGAVAGVQFVLRHMVPVVPLIVCGGVLAASDLWAAARRRRPTAAAV
jgi:hypothetical protein